MIWLLFILLADGRVAASAVSEALCRETQQSVTAGVAVTAELTDGSHVAIVAAHCEPPCDCEGEGEPTS